MKTAKRILTGLAVLPVAAIAASVNVVQTNTLETAQVLASVPSGSYAGVYYDDYEFMFDRFDPSLGSLNEIRFSSSISHTSSATNNNPNTEEWTFITTSYGVNYTANGTVLTGTGAGGGNGTNIYNASFSVTDTAEVVDQQFDPAFYSEFIGTGTMTFGIERYSSQQPGYTSEIFGDFTGFTVQRDPGATVLLTYNYTPFTDSADLSISGNTVSFPSVSNKTYEIQSTTNLQNGIWITCTNLTAIGTNTLIELQSTEPVLFFRGFEVGDY